MIKMIQKNMNKKGFTLVELIIVIAVMAILAAIVIPRMAGVTDSFKVKADERVAATIAREIQVMVQTGIIAELGSDSSREVTTTYTGTTNYVAPELQSLTFAAGTFNITLHDEYDEDGDGTDETGPFIVVQFDDTATPVRDYAILKYSGKIE